ncbi:MAG: hypothetical protein R2758_13765 [Bacteroidales bacterium]
MQNWYKPVYSAFTPKEIETVRKWVEGGGSLFLIADHMPMGGADKEMAAAFGFGFTDGFAIDTAQTGPALFCRAKAPWEITLLPTAGFLPKRLTAYTPLPVRRLRFRRMLTPFSPSTRNTCCCQTQPGYSTRKTVFRPINGWSQLAYKEYGKGRVVMSGRGCHVHSPAGRTAAVPRRHEFSVRT